VLAKASSHRNATRRVFVEIFRQVFHSIDLDLLNLDGEIGAKNTTCHASTVSAVTQMPTALPRE
jgi:hypothetical protein